MKEEKFKKIMVGVTVSAVLLVIILVIFWVYQLIAISVREKKIKELEEQIAYYEQIIKESNDDVEIYKSELWLEWAARKLGMLKKGE